MSDHDSVSPTPPLPSPPLAHEACYRLRLREGPLGAWLWAIAQNLPVVGLAPQIYYAISRRTIDPLLWGSLGLLVGLAPAAVTTLGRLRTTEAIECLARVDPSPHRTLEAEVRQCVWLALPGGGSPSLFSWQFAGLITLTATVGTRFGQNRAAHDARRRLGET